MSTKPDVADDKNKEISANAENSILNYDITAIHCAVAFSIKMSVRSIEKYMQSLEKRICEVDSEMQELTYMQDILNGIMRISNKLLDVTRTINEITYDEVIDVREMFRDAFEEIQKSYNRNCEIKLVLDVDQQPRFGYPPLIKKIITDYVSRKLETIHMNKYKELHIGTPQEVINGETNIEMVFRMVAEASSSLFLANFPSYPQAEEKNILSAIHSGASCSQIPYLFMSCAQNILNTTDIDDASASRLIHRLYVNIVVTLYTRYVWLKLYFKEEDCDLTVDPGLTPLFSTKANEC
ncbi:hypothetical protein CPAST_c05740 [Clostridium pasteurianum DSM 525 = ATCC 6013]|uniref:Uncharacterized protein n=1 Tax=Clostridium pasteurianum DSM 525 = ATCC 6013 TaxID=1262449 RepID=A0A0H3J031_CLOPA|nr:hypothetical protein [Clostridium pasteurianum]AJA46674.1 hypothetical protein CPAST_c05740 [Clostridium pasteurianum DSM 525 = ATCC 6013]AJA50662.1 hypothetical protein CLPA_c05740 [Clostridium pasteurianum DSM 525 = ATCC 6013]AOZ74083.1 hypothetical protein AQ983_02755 [Clostridium pasteurianum DSM 525 = ATCC 6013]AOZ77880.1 hypothetical protein AQ984_02755 [Clostridium pasteurianum]ELP61239.1 hypothetical protein F502_02250 [Clostridium pasteurianum DSM 525 = ATCC 6013]